MAPILATRGAGSALGFGRLAGESFEAAYFSISSILVSSSTSNAYSVVFTSIPSTYKHLELRYYFNNGNANGPGGPNMTFNSDSGGNYNLQSFYGVLNGPSTGLGQDNAASQTRIRCLNTSVQSYGTTMPNTGVIQIPDYTSSKHKTAISESGAVSTTNSESGYFKKEAGIYKGTWNNTSAITSISLSFDNGLAYGVFGLYGVKG